MSGPYPPPPEHDGWWSGNQQGNSYGGQSDQSDFPTVQYSGLGGQQGGGWGEPPQPPRRSTGRLIVAVVSVLVIVGGVATGIVLLQHKHTHRQAAQSNPVAAPVGTPSRGAAQATETGPADPGVPNGSTTLTLADGSCVSAVADDEGQYTATQRATCGTPTSDLVLDTTTADMTGCAAHEYLRLSAPSTGVDCFTLDIKTGDCVDASYLKTPCAQADFRVLTTEEGPGGDDSCTSVDGATHWVPVGRDPVRVGCLGPAPKS